MPYLLDTHTLIWITDTPEKLTPAVRTLVDEFPAEIYISAVSLWEIAIKRSIGKLDFPASAEQLLERALQNGTPIFEIAAKHVVMVETLPFHHRDPFDRLLVAQALAEDFTLVSRDDILDQYGVKRIWD